MDVECPACHTPLSMDDSAAGSTIDCPSCGQAMQLSAAGQSVGPRVDPPSGPPPIPPAETPADPLGDLAVANHQANCGMPHQARELFISPLVRSRLAILAGIVMMVVAGLNAISSHTQVMLLERVANSPAGSVSRYELLCNDSRVQGWAIIFLLTFLAFLVFFLLWKYRAYKNLKALGAREIRMSPGGSVGWYFCPVLHLWKPCQAMNDIWQGSDAATIRPGRSISGGLVGLWWTVFIVRTIYSRIVGNLSMMELERIEHCISITWMDIADSCLMLSFALLTVMIISSVSSKQLQRKRVLDAAATHANAHGVL
jgi:hypothetical protein